MKSAGTLALLALAAIVAFAVGQRCAPAPDGWEARVDSALTVQRAAFQQVMAASAERDRRITARADYHERRADSLAQVAAERIEQPPLPDTATASDSVSWWKQEAENANKKAGDWKLAYESADSASKARFSALNGLRGDLADAAVRIADLERLLAERPDNGKLMECGPGPGVGTELRGELVFACVVPMISIPSPF